MSDLPTRPTARRHSLVARHSSPDRTAADRDIDERRLVSEAPCQSWTVPDQAVWGGGQSHGSQGHNCKYPFRNTLGNSESAADGPRQGWIGSATGKASVGLDRRALGRPGVRGPVDAAGASAEVEGLPLIGVARHRHHAPPSVRPDRAPPQGAEMLRSQSEAQGNPSNNALAAQDERPADSIRELSKRAGESWALMGSCGGTLLEEKSPDGIAVALVEEAAGEHYPAQAQERGYAIALVQGKGVEQEELDDRNRQQAQAG